MPGTATELPSISSSSRLLRPLTELRVSHLTSGRQGCDANRRAESQDDRPLWHVDQPQVEIEGCWPVACESNEASARPNRRRRRTHRLLMCPETACASSQFRSRVREPVSAGSGPRRLLDANGRCTATQCERSSCFGTGSRAGRIRHSPISTARSGREANARREGLPSTCVGRGSASRRPRPLLPSLPRFARC
jgi:hypothetical protein